MKTIVFTFVSVIAWNVAVAGPIVVNSPVGHLFIPTGFDNNDNVEVFVSGEFPNSCYSRNKVEVNVQEETIKINVTALVNSESEKCEDYKVSYLEDVTIGNLQAGDYKVIVNDKISEKLVVAETRSTSVDDYIYGEVDYVELGFTGGLNGEVALVGRTADCIVLDRVVTIDNGKDTLSVLPIMKIASNSCAKQKVQFNIPVNFDQTKFKGEKILLYVKTMDGKSVTSLLQK
ncbi:MAG: hypothetical protein ACOVP4_03655 [Bacteriovoracaceae bacterium]